MTKVVLEHFDSISIWLKNRLKATIETDIQSKGKLPGYKQ